MQKADIRFIWDMAFNTAALFARWTKTKTDDLIIMALRSDEIFEELWAILEARGFVMGNKSVLTRAQVAQLTFSVESNSGTQSV